MLHLVGPMQVDKYLYQHQVAVLDDAAARQLLRRAAHLELEGELAAGLSDVEAAILKACGGLPLALQLMGASLYKKKDVASWQASLVHAHVLLCERSLCISSLLLYDSLSNNICCPSPLKVRTMSHQTPWQYSDQGRPSAHFATTNGDEGLYPASCREDTNCVQRHRITKHNSGPPHPTGVDIISLHR
jgi:hypothetical protein